MSGSDTARDTWQDGGGRECRRVSIDKETKQNAVNFKRDFLLHAAEEVQGERPGAGAGRRSTREDGGRKPQEKSIANSRREMSIANSRREKSIANSRRERSIANGRRGKDKKNRITDFKSRSLVKS